MAGMNIFTLMGTILVDNTAANNSISSTGQQADSLASKLGTGIKNAAGIAAGAFVAIGAAAVGMAVKAVSSSDECQKALNSLQTQTGSTEEEMEGLKESLLAIYSGNYGESFEDVAESISTVKQQTGLAGQELEGFTRNALVLRDTFEYEVAESTRAADMMMKQFGITSEEAFNLIAQGAQNGLDKNENLLDSINEYAVHFAQLGLDAEDMFNIFSNGAQTGVFDIDKLGDAVKEFGIRVKDGTADEAFEQLGLNAEQLKKAFVEGGDGAEQAFQQVNQELANCDDKVLQNTLGVTMYGTMWEDMGAEAVKALSNTNGEIDKTKNTIEQINSIKYDSFGEAMAGIGRQLEVGILIPLGEKLLPFLNEFANWINVHMPEIKATFEVAMQGIGTAIDLLGIGINTLLQFFTNLLNANVSTGDGVKTVWQDIQSFFSATFESIALLISAFIDAATAFWNTWGSEITICISGIWEQIKIIFDTAFKLIIDLFNIFAAAFRGDWEGVWNGIKQFIIDLWDGIKNYIESCLNTINSIVSSVLDKIKQYWDNAWNGIKTFCSNTWDNIKSSVQNGLSNVLTKITELKDKAIETIKKLPSEALQVGKDFVQGFINGVGNMFGALKEKVSEMASSVISKAKEVLGIHSPSRVMMEVGGYTAEGMAKGIEQNVGLVEEAVNDMTAFKDNEYELDVDGNSRGATKGGGVVINMYYPQLSRKDDIKQTSRQLREQLIRGNRALGLGG